MPKVYQTFMKSAALNRCSAVTGYAQKRAVGKHKNKVAATASNMV